MPRLYLVRHGRASASFGESLDPGLSEFGRTQAEKVAHELAHLGPMFILSSPLARARETALPLARLWNCEPVIEKAVAEVPSSSRDLAERAEWLMKFLASSWREVTPELAQWREEAIATLSEIREDTVIFSHFVVLNVAMGAAIGDDRVTVYSPDNCSVTIFENSGGRLSLIERGREAPLTRVN